jgi:hypothetical protein
MLFITDLLFEVKIAKLLCAISAPASATRRPYWVSRNVVVTAHASFCRPRERAEKNGSRFQLNGSAIDPR